MKPRDEIDAIIEAKKTASGAWTRAQLEEWGVSWPPTAGWRKELRKKGLPNGKTIGIADAPFVGIAVPHDFSPISKAYWQTDAAVKDIAFRFSLKSEKQVLKRAGPAALRGISCKQCGTDLVAKNRGEAITEINTFRKSSERFNKVECKECYRKVRDERMRARWTERNRISSVEQHRNADRKTIAKTPDATAKEEFYKSWEWRTLRMEVLKEQGRSCKCCGAEPGMTDAAGNPVRIVVDHIKPISKFWHLRLKKSNLQVLCDECNQGKGNWDQTDFRAPAAPDEWIIEDNGIDRSILEQLSVRGETIQ